MHKFRFFIILFVLALSLSACIPPDPTVSPPLTPTPSESPLVLGTKDPGPLVIIEGPKPVEEETPVENLNFLDVLVMAVTAPQLIFLLCLIVTQFGAAISRAMQTKTFDWERVADFYVTKVLPYGLTYFCLYIVGAYAPTFQGKFFKLLYSYIPGLQEHIDIGLQFAALVPPTGTLVAKLGKDLRQMGILRIFGVEPEPETE